MKYCRPGRRRRRRRRKDRQKDRWSEQEREGRDMVSPRDI